MALSKQLDNGASIVLLYAKEFQWFSDKESKMLGGEPTSGRVYRALKDPQTSAYYVSIDHGVKTGPRVEGVRLSNLKYKTPEWLCDMVEITDDNITDFDISTEDYKKISDWSLTGHQDFVTHLEKMQSLDVIASKSDEIEESEGFSIEETKAYDPEEIGRKIMDAMTNSIIPFQTNCHDMINYVGMRDPWTLQALEQVLTEITKQIAAEDSGPIIALSRELAVSEDMGKGANIYSTLYNIEEYINTNEEIGGKISNVTKAIYHLILELIRLKTQEK